MAVVTEPGAALFVRLKLRTLRNGLRGRRGRVVLLILGVLFGLYLAGLAVVGFVASAEATSLEVQQMIAVYAGSAIVLGWTLVPLLFFGIDETLDPARFALLPLRRSTLLRGMFVAAFVGVPAAATMLASLGLVAAAWLRFGPVAALAALIGAAAGLGLGVLASRAVTSAFAAALRSRRMRDLAIVVIALLASSFGPLQLLIQSAAANGSVDQARLGARILAFTPFGAPYALPFDVAGGRWVQAAAGVAVTAATFWLLARWWSRSLESAMLATSTGAAPRPGRPTRQGAVGTLVPRALGGLIRPSVTGAIVAGELRLWWRDPRRRAGLTSILIASAVVAVALNVVRPQGSALAEGGHLLRYGFVVTLCGTMAGMLLANQFAYDGTAYATHLLAQVPARVQIRARALAVGIVSLPIQVAVVVVVGVLSGAVEQLPAGLGLLAAAFGVSVAVAGVMSVIAPYPLPDNPNPFALNSGGAGAKGLLALVALIGTVALCTPMLVVSVLVSSTAPGPWLVAALGIAYGVAAAQLGAVIAGDVLERRGPELLAAISRRR